MHTGSMKCIKQLTGSLKTETTWEEENAYMSTAELVQDRLQQRAFMMRCSFSDNQKSC
jgi:hypothetical protein